MTLIDTKNEGIIITIIPSNIILTYRDSKAGDNPKPFAEVSRNLVACNLSKELAIGNNQL